jgi:2-polyprenyl-3-methyl-5-hydroxy-6-metoxy-1,4-benzoquinol methylase
MSVLRDLGYRNLAGFDISAENVEICHKSGLTFVDQLDALRLEQHRPGERYGVVFLMDVIEHLPKESGVSFLEQVRERLVPGGCAVIQTPNMGCVFGHYHRFNDLTHEFCLTEKSARDLMVAAGFKPTDIEIRPAWSATTALGRLREQYLKILHRLIFLAEDSSRPKIPTKNLLIRGTKQ